MARTPLDQPLRYYATSNPDHGRTPAGTYLDLEAEPRETVYSPVRGGVAYIGDGTEDPFRGMAPGVMAILDADGRYLHVLGFLDDDASVRRTLESAGLKAGWFGGAKPRPSVWNSGLVNWVRGTFGPAKQKELPPIAEGAVIGTVSPARNVLRWQIVSMFGDDKLGEIIDPIQWMIDRALPRPVPIHRDSPQPAAPRAPAPPSDDSTWLVLLAVAGGALVWARRRNRKQPRARGGTSARRKSAHGRMTR